MFESAVKKLTAWYVGALFLVCLIFSVPTYAIASDRLERAAAKQAQIIQEFDGPFSAGLPTQFRILREEQLQHDRQVLLRTMVIANLAILAFGAYFSYQFAERTLKPIEEAHEAQARFTTDASHELRTPLATMQTEIEVALRDKKFNAALAKSVLRSNLEEIGRLRTLSEQLLHLARLDSGQLEKAPIPLGTLIEKELQHIEKHQQITLAQTIEKGVTVQGDEHLLRQLLSILADNAIKYAGSKPPRAEVRLRKKDGTALLSFTDYGMGIKASELPHIFDRFYRGASATRHSSNGQGLGLSLAQQIVQAHGGTIKALSEVDKQTTFEITLPTV